MQFNQQPYNQSPFNVDGSAGPEYTAKTACHQIERHIHARVTITYAAPDLDQSATVTVVSGGTVDGTSAQHLVDGYKGVEYPQFSLRQDTGVPVCKLDGTYYPMPADTVGWWSTELSDVDRGFNAVPVIDIEFDTPRPFYELTLYGSDKFEVDPTTHQYIQNYPTAFEIRLYDEAGWADRDDTPPEVPYIYKKEVSGNTEWDWSYLLPAEVSDVKGMRVYIHNINLQYRPAVITELFSLYSETYDEDDIIYLSLLEERDYQGGTIPLGNVSANECVVRLNNADKRFSVDNRGSPLYNLIRKNRKIEIELGVEVPLGGDISWYPAGTYWSMDWNTPHEEVYAEVIGFDLLERMRNSEYYSKEIYTDETLYDLAITVLADYGIDTDDTTLYYIHPDLKNITIPFGYFGRTTHRDALVEIAEAGMCCCYIDRLGRVVIDRYDDTDTVPTYVLTADRYFSKDTPLNFSELVNYIEIVPHPRTAGELTQVYRDTEPFDVGPGETVTKQCIFSSSDPVTDVETVADGNVENSYYTQTGAGTIHIEEAEQVNYSWMTELKFHNITNDTATVTGIYIRGKPLEITGGAVAIAQDEESIRLNGKLALQSPIENELIQSTEYAQEIANDILAVYKNPRRDITVSARGYTTSNLGEVMRVATIDSRYSTDYLISRQRVEYDGGMRVEMTGIAVGDD